MTNVRLDREGVKAKFGVPPACMVDYLTLVGDTSDNIPGVPQVGPKTAAKWLQEYGSLAKIVASAHLFKGKAGENLRASFDQLPLVKSLVTIKLDVNLTFDFPDLKIKLPDKKILIDLYKEMEFKGLLAELLEESKDEHADI